MISDSNKYAKKSQIVHIKQINGKINKEEFIFLPDEEWWPT
jgi:hypothetical protein